MSMVDRWRAWKDARDERVVADKVAAWQEIEQRVRGDHRAAQPGRTRLSPTAEDLAAIANPDRRPPADHHASIASRRVHEITSVRQRAAGTQANRARSDQAGSFADLLKTVSNLGEAEIERMTAVTASTIDWCVGVRAALHLARRELATAATPRAVPRTGRRPARRAVSRRRP